MDDAVTKLESADIAVILKLLPHRYPFLMIDRVIDICGDQSGVGIKNVTFNEPHFQGHFPGNPVFPGVLLIEGMAQTGGVLCILATGSVKPKSVYFMTINKAKFRKPVAAGRHRRVSHDPHRPAAQHVVVQRRGQGRRPGRRRSRGQRDDQRRMSAAIDRSHRRGSKAGR